MHEVLKSIVAEAGETQLSSEALHRMAVQWVAWVHGTMLGRFPEGLCYPSLAKPAQLHELLDRLRQSEFDHVAPPAEDVAVVGDRMIDMLDKAANLVRKGAFDQGPVDLGTCWADVEPVPFLVPDLADLLVMMADLGETSSVYCAWDGYAQLACRAAERASGSIALETPGRSPAPMIAGLATGRPLTVRHADPIMAPTFVEQGQPCLFDRVVAIPPLGTRYGRLPAGNFDPERFPEHTNAGAVLQVRHALWHSRQRVVVMVPNQLLFGSYAEKQLREAVVAERWLKAVIGMADGMLQESHKGFSILVFDKRQANQTVRFIDATDTEDARLYEADKEAANRGRLRIRDPAWLASLVDAELDEGEGGIVSDVSVDDLAAHDHDLSVSRYVLSRQQKRLQQQLNSVPTTELRKVATVIRHRRTFTSALKDDGQSMMVHEIGSADLPTTGLIRHPTKSTRICAKTARKHEGDFLRPHDIVLIIKGSAGKIGLVPEDVPPPGEGGWMVSQTAVAIRVTDRDRIDPVNLFTQLRSPIGLALFERIGAGSTIPLIRLGDLESLPVFLPSAEQSAANQTLFDREVSLQAEIDQRRAEQASIAEQLWPF